MESSMCLFVAGVQYQNSAHRAWTVNRLRDIARLTGWQTALAVLTGCETSWVRAGEMGNGPPYARTREERSAPENWSSSADSNKESRQVINTADRVHYAMGIIGVQEDLERLDLDNDDRTNLG